MRQPGENRKFIDRSLRPIQPGISLAAAQQAVELHDMLQRTASASAKTSIVGERIALTSFDQSKSLRPISPI